MAKSVLVLDVGTSGIKAFIFDSNFKVVGKSYEKIKEMNLHQGHIEQDPRLIFDTSVNVMRNVLKENNVSADDISCIAITNQRESIVAWDKETSWPFYPAILWKDNRTEKYCSDFSIADQEKVTAKTGLPIKSYFSASKINWLLNNVPEVKLAKERGCLACGTLDSWLIWNLTENHELVTDWTNASRTMLFDIREKKWDDYLLSIFGVPKEILPRVEKSRADFGMLDQKILGKAVPIVAVCGDQQSSLYAAGVKTGTTKITYGTGVFIMQITGDKFSLLEDFFTTLDANGNYVLEAKVDRGGKDVEVLLGSDEGLRLFLKKVASEVDYFVKKLPIKQDEIVIDGGVTRDGIIGQYQEEVSGIKIIEQEIFDGTALGVAKVAFS